MNSPEQSPFAAHATTYDDHLSSEPVQHITEVTFHDAMLRSRAFQWLANGDHPLDYADLRMDNDSPSSAREGAVVRYYCHPGVRGEEICKDCGIEMRRHGWIDCGGEGEKVCPGDWFVESPYEANNWTHVGKADFESVWHLHVDPKAADERATSIEKPCATSEVQRGLLDAPNLDAPYTSPVSAEDVQKLQALIERQRADIRNLQAEAQTNDEHWVVAEILRAEAAEGRAELKRLRDTLSVFGTRLNAQFDDTQNALDRVKQYAALIGTITERSNIAQPETPMRTTAGAHNVP